MRRRTNKQKLECNAIIHTASVSAGAIGAGLAQDKDTMQVTITRVYEGTPSESAGLRNEDVILSVDGTEADTMDVTDLVKLIRGEAGTTVHLEIYRPERISRLTWSVPM